MIRLFLIILFKMNTIIIQNKKIKKVIEQMKISY